ncbi:hypothetical protein ACFQ4K_02360 [Tistrella bauzanensis]
MLSLDVTDQNAQLYRSGPVEVRYIVAQTVAVRTTEVDKVEAASQKVGALVEAGWCCRTRWAPLAAARLSSSPN